MPEFKGGLQRCVDGTFRREGRSACGRVCSPGSRRERSVRWHLRAQAWVRSGWNCRFNIGDGIQGCLRSRVAKVPYLIDDNQAWLPAHIDTGVCRKRLLLFKAALLKRHICQTFGDQLAVKVVADIGRHFSMQAATRVGPGIPVQNIGFDSAFNPVIETSGEWSERRSDIYNRHRDAFLTHIIRPSARPGQNFSSIAKKYVDLLYIY